ncbi:MAG: MmcQ/YjbR family DNA-binding protein [Actinomycetota bacterium]|nr:MmcQ/YjbR family DNA-binding protein [Actinomycetota bacterium]
MTTEDRYADLVRAFLGRPGVTQAGTGFGSSALKVGGRIFAMLSSRGDYVVKLPRTRVDALIASGDGVRFDPGHGRLMKEWLAVRPSSGLDWLDLANEAMAFVGR